MSDELIDAVTTAPLEKARAASDSVSLTTGTVLGDRYRIVELLGRRDSRDSAGYRARAVWSGRALVSFMLSVMLLESVVTYDMSAWYAGPSITALIAVLALAAYGAWAALTKRPEPSLVRIASSLHTS